MNIATERATLDPVSSIYSSKQKPKKHKNRKLNNKQKPLKTLDNAEDDEFYDHVPVKLNDDLKSIEKRLLKKLKAKGDKGKGSLEESPFRQSKMSMPQINTKEKFYSTRTTSSSSMLPYITHSSINSGLSNGLRSPVAESTDGAMSLIRNNRYGDFNIGSLKRNLQKEMVENDSMVDALRRSPH